MTKKKTNKKKKNTKKNTKGDSNHESVPSMPPNNNNNNNNNSTTTAANQKSNPSKKKSTKTVAPALECSSMEYSDLQTQASSLTLPEARKELLECARYGELDAVRALLSFHSSSSSSCDGNEATNTTNSETAYIDTQDESSGSTALHYASANGHTSVVQLLLSSNASWCRNKSGNSPLHWAAAGGHDSVVKLLLGHDFGRGVKMDVLEKNEFGRGALTEGFAGKHTATVGLLLEHESADEERLIGGCEKQEVEDDGLTNVEESAIDEDHDHAPSAGGEAAAATTTVTTAATTTATPTLSPAKSTNDHQAPTPASVNDDEPGIIHVFDFLRDGALDNQNSNIIINNTTTANTTPITVSIRELPISNADSPFGDDPIHDTTGLGIWCASLVLARWMAAQAKTGRFDHTRVLELGSGCGVPGLTLAKYAKGATVCLTDVNPVTIDNLNYNVALNDDSNHHDNNTNTDANDTDAKNTPWNERVTASSIDWGNSSTWPTSTNEKMDYVIGSDLIYQKSVVPLLHNVVSGCLKDNGAFLYVCPADGRDGLKEFVAAMKGDGGSGREKEDGCGFVCTSDEAAPDLYKTNPLENGDEEDAFLHFNELAVTEYRLYEFRRRKAGDAIR